MTADVVIASSGLTVTVSPDGAELRRIVDDEGRDLLWDGDPKFWTGRAPLLFPIVGAVAGGRYRVDGAEYALEKHGFARRSRFEVVETGADFVLFRLTDSAATRAVYPFAFSLEMRFEVAGHRLAMTATLTNPGEVSLPASFGFHPALRWPLPYGAERGEHVVRFDQLEPEAVRTVTPDGLIAAERFPSPVEGHMLVLRDELFAVDAVIFEDVRSRGLWYGGAGGTGVRVDFADMPDLGIWTKPGAGYLCIEPWQGMADSDGYAGDFRDKPGVVEVAPGAARVFAMQMEFGVSA
ncbi:aldose 1-epimerase family protein [Sphingomonas prati]|uniref:Galactose mutarotase-like enzyme n=1 Tax=Sphingomonas prati TaxID=1843237 RepID=A0A7W9BQE7_9SPHN|nr:aldose 1-epimerase family protein [Sphingomonas prati]MBB5727718.1 galactose mutarotase-like enzyme [Sphingomonas prati]GGE80169.1 aldose 1-epimerase [Sphingomonas prati]